MAISLKCRKYLVLSFIIISTLTAVALLVVGSGILFLYGTKFKLVFDSLGWVPMLVLMLCGLFTVFLSYFGWHSVTRKKGGLVIVYTCLVILLIIILLFVVGYSLSIRESLPNESVQKIELSFTQSLQHDDQKFSAYWEKLQNENKCCGLSGPTDYRTVMGKSSGIPWACCSAESEASGSCGQVFQRGCIDVVIEQVQKLLAYTAITALAGALVQSLGIFCSVQLARELRRLEKIRKATDKALSEVKGPRGGKPLLGLSSSKV